MAPFVNIRFVSPPVFAEVNALLFECIKIRLGGGAIVGGKDNQGVVFLIGFFEGTENFTHRPVGFQKEIGIVPNPLFPFHCWSGTIGVCGEGIGK